MERLKIGWTPGGGLYGGGRGMVKREGYDRNGLGGGGKLKEITLGLKSCKTSGNMSKTYSQGNKINRSTKR